MLSFDIHADMAPTFHWNIKQIFVCVVAEYPSEANDINRVVLWDKIIEATDESKVIDEQNVFVKYALVDQGTELRGKQVELKLLWDHMPITGMLFMGHQKADQVASFSLPSEYDLPRH